MPLQRHPERCCYARVTSVFSRSYLEQQAHWKYNSRACDEELTPALLRVNKQLYEVGIWVLYSKNKIPIDSDPVRGLRYNPGTLSIESPLFETDFGLIRKNPRTHPFEWMRNLRVVQRFAAKGALLPDKRAVKLWSQIRHLRLRNLEVTLTQDCRSWEPRTYTLEDLKLTLAPLRVLRRIEVVEFSSEWLRYHDPESDDDEQVNAAVAAEKIRVIELLQGDSEVEEIEAVEEVEENISVW
ncbi:hypothetical protein ACMFMG_006359 [Clarireedia jacksonii]